MAILEVFFQAFEFIFDTWPLILLLALIGKKANFRKSLYFWLLFAGMRIVLLFSPEPTDISLLLDEPLNTILFFATGLFLAALWIGSYLWRSRRLRRKAFGLSPSDLLDLPPGEFEEMTAELYRTLGYQAQRTGMSGDHGVDVVVTLQNGQKLIVQCKRWRKPVGEKIIRDFYGTMQHEKAAQGTIIGISGFTPQAIDWAKGKPISLRTGQDFLKEWDKAKPKHS